MSLAEQISTWLRDYAETAGADGYVLGLSGGVDSATAAALAARAVGSESVLGVLMPCHSQPEDLRLGQEVADAFGIRTITVDLSGPYNTLLAAVPPSESDLASANVKPRLRMMVLYYLAQTHNYLVLGSGNKTELVVGYFTKYGDGGVDLLPLGGVYKTEVWELARELQVPREVVERPPTAGLWPGQTDEKEMGITYDELDRILKAIEAGGTDGILKDQLDKVKRMMAESAHKRRTPPIFEPRRGNG